MQEKKLSNKSWKAMILELQQFRGNDIFPKLELLFATLAEKHMKPLHKEILDEGVRESYLHLKKITVLDIEGLNGGELGPYIVKYMRDVQFALAKKGINSFYAQMALKAGTQCIFKKDNSIEEFGARYLTQLVEAFINMDLATVIGSSQFPGFNALEKFNQDALEIFTNQLKGIKNFNDFSKKLSIYDKDTKVLLHNLIPQNRRVQKGLIIKERYLKRFFEEGKTAEVRSRPVSIRGKIYLCCPETKEVLGEANLHSVLEVKKEDYHKFVHLHKSSDFEGYPVNYLWMMKDIIKYKKPVPYKHKKGCVIWIDLQGIKDEE